MFLSSSTSWAMQKKIKKRINIQSEDLNDMTVKNISMFSLISIVVRWHELNLWLTNDSINVNKFIIDGQTCRMKHDVRCIIVKKILTDSFSLMISLNHRVVERLVRENSCETDSWYFFVVHGFVERLSMDPCQLSVSVCDTKAVQLKHFQVLQLDG